MRLPNKFPTRLLALALTVPLAACGAISGSDRVAQAKIADPVSSSSLGPQADYPMVLGDPYNIDGVEYVPADTWNYDEVGYASLDGGEGVTAAHRTLPLPSYVEVTSLESGKTALVRIERRGPMTGASLLALSPDALAQIEAVDGAAVRVRRVNPPEIERAALRAGERAPDRLETPESLLVVLRRKLPEEGSASLAQSQSPAIAEAPVVNSAEPAPTIAIDLPPDAESEEPAVTAVSLAAKPPKPRPSESEVSKPTESGEGLVVQAAAFSVEENARRAAKALGGFVVPSGRFFRVQTGPYTSRGQANAALAKVKAAGYSDARVTSAG